MATKIVGLDLGQHTVKACEVLTTFRNFELVGFAMEPVEAIEEEGVSEFAPLARAAKRLLTRRGLQNETLFCTLPAQSFSTVTLDFPFDQPKKIEAVLPSELEELMPFEADDVIWDYQIVAKQGTTTTVLVAYILREVFEKFLEAMAAEGLDPKICSVSALSWFNLYDTLIAGQPGPVAVIDMGHTHTELCILAPPGQEGPIVDVREIPGGGEDITKALAEVFHVNMVQAERGKIAEGFIAPTLENPDPAGGDQANRRYWINRTLRETLEPTLRDIHQTLARYEQTQHVSFSRVFVTGGSAAIRGLLTTLEARLGIPTSLFNPLAMPQNRLANGGQEYQNFAGKAVAISARASAREHQSQINFRKGPYVYTGDFGFLRGRLIFLGLAVAAIIALFIMSTVSHRRVLEAEYQTMLSQARAISKPILGIESDDLDLLYNTVVNTDKKDATSIPEISAFEILGQISEKIGFDVEVDLDHFDIDMDRKKLSLDGRTKSGGDVERIVEAIQATQCFKGRVTKESVTKTSDDRTKFKLSALATCL